MRLTELMLNSNEKIKQISGEELGELKKTLLGIYKDIFDVCEKNGMKIFLGGGSCLGAVRHHGFIPWDDDIDLNMFRADYEVLPVLLEKEFHGKYKCVFPNQAMNSRVPFMEVHKIGTLLRRHYDLPEDKPWICIDIFPIESIPDNKLLQIFHACVIDFFFFSGVCVRLYEKRDSIGVKLLKSTFKGCLFIAMRIVIGFILHFKKSSWWDYKGDVVAKKYKDRNSKYISIPTGRRHYFGEKLPAKNLLPAKKVDFENEGAYIYNNYVEYLTSLYGENYMIPPAENKREHHFCLEIKF
ncbi:MAG: LicD family protein [Treponema sp.]|nr:LicD family protein [Treponema sp.]